MNQIRNMLREIVRGELATAGYLNNDGEPTAMYHATATEHGTVVPVSIDGGSVAWVTLYPEAWEAVTTVGIGARIFE